MVSGYILNANKVGDEKSRFEDNLRRALESRDLIGQAKGILMSQHRLTAEAAFELLRRTSQARNVKLREIAAQIVDTGASPEGTD